MQMSSFPYYQSKDYLPQADNQNRREMFGLLVVFLAHALALFIAFWSPESPNLPIPTTPPQVMEASLITLASPQPPIEIAPGPQQIEAAAAPKPVERIEQKQELLTAKDAINTMESAPELPEPVKEEIPKEVEEKVVNEQQTPAKPAPETTAPPSTPAPPAETAAAPVSGSSQQQTEVQINWQQQLQIHLERRKRYPRAAQMRRQEGMPWVKFSMNREGDVLSVELVESSGVAALDKEALALVKRADPLPIPPKEITGDVITLTVPIEFFINS